MIKQAYFRGLMKVAQKKQVDSAQVQQQYKDHLLAGAYRLPSELKDHGFYKGTPSAEKYDDKNYGPRDIFGYRVLQAKNSTKKFAPNEFDPVGANLIRYYINIGRQNRDFYLKHGFRPPKDHKYKTPFPYPNHPKKKQMMLQNQWQVNNNRGQQYKGHA